LKIDSRTQLDIYNQIIFNWKTVEGKAIESYSHAGKELPERLPIPSVESVMVLEYQVVNKLEVIYSEQVPIFHQPYVEYKIQEILEEERLSRTWKNGLRAMFIESSMDESAQNYSTRMKAEFLWDVLQVITPFGYNIAGPRMEIFNGTLARRYIPQRPNGEIIVGIT
jgi:hypothetical protein